MSDILRFRKGEIIMEEGSEGVLAYVIISGSAEVYRTAKGKKIVFEALGPGSIVGEMSLITGEPRKATVVALEDTIVTALNRDTFETAILENPETIIPLLTQVFRRLNFLDQMIMAFYETGGIDGARMAGKAIRLLAATKEAEKAAGRKEILIAKTPFFIGRVSREQVVETRDLSLVDREPYEISRNHCVVVFFRGEYHILDSSSTMGTEVGGTRIGRKEAVKNLSLKKGTHRIVLGSRSSPYVFDLEIS